MKKPKAEKEKTHLEKMREKFAKMAIEDPKGFEKMLAEFKAVGPHLHRQYGKMPDLSKSAFFQK